MEIESEIPFPKELQDLLEDQIFKRQLILWYYFKKKLNMTEISKEADVPYQIIRDCITKWKIRDSIQDLKKVGRPSSVFSKEQKDIQVP